MNKTIKYNVYKLSMIELALSLISRAYCLNGRDVVNLMGDTTRKYKENANNTDAREVQRECYDLTMSNIKESLSSIKKNGVEWYLKDAFAFFLNELKDFKVDD